MFSVFSDCVHTAAVYRIQYLLCSAAIAISGDAVEGGGAEIFVLYSIHKHMHAEPGVNQHVCTCGL